jgi:hypothetical protein
MMMTMEERRVLKNNMPGVVLEEVHTRNCNVLPTRMHLLDRLPKGGVVAEVGVAFGDFTKQILLRNNPSKLHLVDAWEADGYQDVLEKILERYSKEIATGAIEINRGLSRERLSEFSDEYLDWIYIDTDHSYLTTRDELLIASKKVKPGGYIAGHDFTSGNPVKAVPYGVIQACNEFCVNEGWGYEFLTLEPSGHSSFALKKILR